MKKLKKFDEFTMAKLAFQLGYTDVFRNDFGPDGVLASPSRFIIDSCVVNDFADNYEFVREETDLGDFFYFESKEKLDLFLKKHKKEVEKSESVRADYLLQEKLNESKKYSAEVRKILDVLMEENSDYEFGFEGEDSLYYYFLADTEFGNYACKISKKTFEEHWRYGDGTSEDGWQLLGVLKIKES